ncbi:MAG: heavy metal translocating P-type ATPase [Oscillospiraceae bacterium]|nr:heavy metal translocating P-type ATPase [Oscillospiraceae bacterium]
MEQYNITGMSCASCSARVEKAVSSVKGVTSCSVNLLTNSMAVEGTASTESIISAVQKAGYGAYPKNNPKTDDYDDMLADKETPVLKKRLVYSIVFLIILMYFSMGYTMWGWYLPPFFDGNYIAIGIIQLLLTIIIMFINRKFFISGFRSVLHGSPNMDTLVALGSGASFVYSLYALFAMTSAQVRGDNQAVMHYMHEFYFESSAMILTLITVGKTLEAYSKGKTTDALKSLMKLAPKNATVIRDGKELKIPTEEVRKGDIFVVRPGENIPVDGIVTEGISAVNESALTGESIPADKSEGDYVSSGTINQSGFIKCKALKVGEDTALSQIIKMVSEASSAKAPVAKIADKVSGIFVPVVMAIAIIDVIIWLLSGESFGFALARGISVLVISCPCALGLATPVAIMVGNGLGAKNGILFKTAESLEEAGKVNIVALDKTGTVTRGEPEVTDIVPVNGFSENEFLSMAFSLEIKSEHPLAGAVIKKARELGIEPEEVSDFMAVAGNGLTARLNDSVLSGGNFRFISSLTDIPDNIFRLSEKLSEQGKTPLFFCKDKKLTGIIAVADVIKEEAPQAVRELQNMGIRVVMLTGDNQRTANAVGKLAGVDEVIAEVLPEGKASVIKQLQKKGKVAMVGDGINDAPALAGADIGIAIGAGTDVAIDSANIVLMKSRVTDVPAAIRLSRKTLRNIHENLFWAFIYNVIGIPLAGGLWIPILGLKLNPMFGAMAMSLSSFCVVANALRLNLFNVHNPAGDKKIKYKLKPERNVSTMQKTIKIEGMMCGHCEASVKKALEAIPSVESAEVSHEKGTAVVTLSSDTPDEVLRKAVEDKDYTVISVS